MLSFLRLFSFISLRTRISAEAPRWWTQLESCGHCRRGIGAVRAVCRAWKALEAVWPAGTD